MIDSLKIIAEWCAAIIEATGLAVITGLILIALGLAVKEFVQGSVAYEVYLRTRLRVGHGILLGLEFLVAADIIHTVAVELNFETVGVLAIIVLIRTFLSFALTVELTGRWPWQEAKASSQPQKI